MIKGIGKIVSLLILISFIVVAFIIVFKYSNGEAIGKINALGEFIDKIFPLLVILMGGVASKGIAGAIIDKIKGGKNE
jgi:hypothetical protein